MPGLPEGEDIEAEGLQGGVVVVAVVLHLQDLDGNVAVPVALVY